MRVGRGGGRTISGFDEDDGGGRLGWMDGDGDSEIRGGVGISGEPAEPT